MIIIEKRRLKNHLGWIVITTLLFVFSAAYYIYYSRTAPGGPTGKSWPGLAYGVAGSLLMLFAGLFNLRKKFPRMIRLGNAQFWMRGHIWLGLLSVPLILFHSGFRLGGLLELVMMILFFIIIASGLFGLLLQQYLPRGIKTNVAAETMYQLVPDVCMNLRKTADAEVNKKCGSLFEREAKNRPTTALKSFYLDQVRGFLIAEYNAKSALCNASQATALFEDVRDVLPEDPEDPTDTKHPRLRTTLDNLEKMCDERRELEVQVRMHRWLHYWLFLHIPLSMALLVLALIHVYKCIIAN